MDAGSPSRCGGLERAVSQSFFSPSGNDLLLGHCPSGLGNRLWSSIRLELQGNGFGCERFGQGVLVALKNVRILLNNFLDRLYLVRSQFRVELDRRIQIKRGRVDAGIGMVYQPFAQLIQG